VGVVAGGKGLRRPAPGDQKEENPRLTLITALPLSVWQEHIMPALSLRSATRLRRLCKALKALVEQ
jgi:hypothetical protein